MFRIMPPLNRCNLAFQVRLIVVVILEYEAATLDKVKTVDFLVRVLQTTESRLHEAEVDISRICNGPQAVEPAGEGKLIKTIVHHINRVDNLRVPQQFNHVHQLKVHLHHLQTTTIHFGHPRIYKLKTRV